MWHPYYNVPLLTSLPFPLDNGVEVTGHAAGVIQWPPSVHVNQTLTTWRGFPAFPKAAQSSKEAKVFLIHRSLYDLIKGPVILEMTDQKLLGWYLSLPVEDRYLIKEQGGLRVFLQKHPALGVTGEVVYVKEEIRRAHRAEETQALTESSHSRSSQYCCCCAPSSSSAARMCRKCCNAWAEPQEGFLSVEEKELILLPNDLKRELNLCGSDECVMDEAGKPIRQQVASPLPVDCLVDQQDSCQSACKTCHVMETHPLRHEVPRSHALEPSGQGAMAGLQWSPEHKDHAKNMEDLKNLQEPEFGGVEEAGVVQKSTEGANQSAYEDCFAYNALDKARNSRPLTHERFLAVDGKITMNQSEEINSDHWGKVMSSSDKQSTRVKKCSSLEPQIVWCDAAVSTDLTTSHQSVQTLPVSTAEKSIITDVYMADLDYFKQEFIRLKLVEAEVGTLKDELKSFEGKERDGVQRAVQAELSLLALQHAMCQQHCWRCCCTSPEGSSFLLGKKILPESMFEVLQILEDDYQEMRKNILSGVPLDQLRPLSVDCQKITSERRYFSAEEINSVPENKSCFCEGSVLTEYFGRGRQGLECGICTSLLEGLSEKMEAFTNQGSGQFGENAASPIRTIDAPGLESFKESSRNKDSQEGEKSHTAAAENDSETPGKGFFHEQDMDQYLLGVNDLPNDTTENVDQFGKYQASGVKMTVSIKNVRMTTVSVQSPGAANRAVGDLNSHVVKGHPIEVQQIPDATGMVQQKQACSSDSCRSVGDTQGSKHGTPAVMAKGLSLPLDKLVNIQDSPTSSGIFVPKRTVPDGFGTLMAQLSLRHPGVAQGSIVDALLELLAGHHGFLSNLPQETIVEMTSSLLKRTPSEEVSLQM